MAAIYDDNLPQQKGRLRLALWAFAGLLLLAPAIAMQITPEMNWGPRDFLAAGLLIVGAGLGIELAVRLVKSRAWMFTMIAAVVLLALLVWAELAVGLID